MKKTLLVIFFCLFFYPKLTWAVDFSWLRSAERVCLFLSTSGESVNAISGKVILKNLKEARFSEANSIVNFWLKKPEISDGGLEGIIPGGFSGEMGQIGCFDLSVNSGVAGISLEEAKVFLNDGNGTEFLVKDARLRLSEDVIGLAPSTTMIETVSVEDKYPPEDFSPLIATDEEIFSGKNFIVFATEDKNSGMDHYEVLESDFAWRQKNGTIKPLTLGGWKKVESPYVLQDQELKSYVFLRAIDREGNIRNVVMEPTIRVRWYERSPRLLFGLILSLIVILTGYFIKRHK